MIQWPIGVVLSPHLPEVKVDVLLGRRDVGVSQNALLGESVAAIQDAGLRHAVAQGVGARARAFHARLSRAPRDDLPDPRRCHLPAEPRRKESSRGGFADEAVARPQVAVELARQREAERHPPLLVALAAHQHRARRKVEVLNLEAA